MWENALTLLNSFIPTFVLVLQIIAICTLRRVYTAICGHLHVAKEEKVSLSPTPDEVSVCTFAISKAKCDLKHFQDNISAKEDIKQQSAIDSPDKSENKCNVCAKERVCSCSFPLSACEHNTTQDDLNNDNCLVDETDTTAIDIGSVESETDQGEDENIDSQCSSLETNEAKLQGNIERHDEVENCHGRSEFDFAEAKHEHSNNHDQVDGKSQRNNKVNLQGERSVSLPLDVHANTDRYDTVLLNEQVDSNSLNNNERANPISLNNILDADFEENNVSSISLHEASKIPGIRESCGNELGHRNSVDFGRNSLLDSFAHNCSVEEMYENCHNGKEEYCRHAVAINTTCNYEYDTCGFTSSVNSCIETNLLDADFEENNVSSISLHEASKIPGIRESCGNELGHRNSVDFGRNSLLDSFAHNCSVEELYENCHNGKEEYSRHAVAINTTCKYEYDTCGFTSSVNSCIETNQNSYNGTDDNAFVSTDCTIEDTDVCYNNVMNNGDEYKAERYSNSMTKQDENEFKCQGVQETFSEKVSIEPYEHVISNDTTCGGDINGMIRELNVSENLCAQGLDNTCSSKCNVFDTKNIALNTDLIDKCSSVEQDENVVCNDLSHHGPQTDQPVPVSEFIPEQEHIDHQIENITEIETKTKLQQCLDEELQCGSEFDPYDFVDEVDYLTSDVFYVKVHKPSLKKLQVKILGDAEENATKESKAAGKENDNQDCITVMDGKTSNTKASNENAVKKMVMGVNRCVVEAPQEASGHFFPDSGSNDVKEQKKTPPTSVLQNRTRQRTIEVTGPSSQQQQNNSYTFAISCKTNKDFMLTDTTTLIIQMSFSKTSIARKNIVYAICRPKKQSNPIGGQAHIWADSRFPLAVDKLWVSCKAAFQKHPITVPWASCSGTIEQKLSFQRPLNDRGIEHYIKQQLQNVNGGHMSLHVAKKSEEAETVSVFRGQEKCDQSSLPIQIKPSIRGQKESPISLQEEQTLREGDILKTDAELYTPEKDSEGSFLLLNLHHEKDITETDAFPVIRLNPGVQLLVNDVDTMIKLEVSSAKHKQKSIQIPDANHMCVHLRQEVDEGYNSFESETDGVTYTDCDIEVDTVPDIQVQLKETTSLQKLTPECFQCHRGPYSDGQFPVSCYTNQALMSDSSTCKTVDEVGNLASEVCYMEVHKPSLKNMQVKILGDAEQNATKESKTADKENDSEDCITLMEGNLCNTTASKETAVNKVFIDVNRCDVEALQEASGKCFPDSGSKDVKEPNETLLTSETGAIPDILLNPGVQLLANDVDTMINEGQQRHNCLNPTLPDRLCPKSRPEHLAATAEELHKFHETQQKSEVSSVKHSPGRKIQIGEDNSMFVNVRQDVDGGYSSIESETDGVINTDCEIKVDAVSDVRDNANTLQISRPEDLQCNRGHYSSEPYPDSCYNNQASKSDSTTYETAILTIRRCGNDCQLQQQIDVVSDCVSLKDTAIQVGEQNTFTLDLSSDSGYNSMDSFSSDENEIFKSSYNSLHGAYNVSKDDIYSSMDSMSSERNKQFESSDSKRYQASDVSSNDSNSSMDSMSSERNNQFESSDSNRYQASDASSNDSNSSMDSMSSERNNQFESSDSNRYQASDVSNNDANSSMDSTASKRNKEFESFNGSRYEGSDAINNDSDSSMDSTASERNKEFESFNRRSYEGSDVNNNDSDSSIDSTSSKRNKEIESFYSRYEGSDVSNNEFYSCIDSMSFQRKKQFERSNTSRYEESDVSNNDSYRSRDSMSSKRHKKFKSSYSSMYEAPDVSFHDPYSSIDRASDVSNTTSLNKSNAESDAECHIDDPDSQDDKDNDATVGIKCKMKLTATDDKGLYQNIGDGDLSIIDKYDIFDKTENMQPNYISVRQTPENIGMQFCHQDQTLIKMIDINTNCSRNGDLQCLRAEHQSHIIDNIVPPPFRQVEGKTDYRNCTVRPALEPSKVDLQSLRVEHQCNDNVDTLSQLFDPMEREKEYGNFIVSPTFEFAEGETDLHICIKDRSQLVLSIGEQHITIYVIQDSIRERKEKGLQTLKGICIPFKGYSIKLVLQGEYDIIAILIGNVNIVQVIT